VWCTQFGFVEDELRTPLVFASLGDKCDTWLSERWLRWAVGYRMAHS
jgi:hypothetical protein